MLTTKEQSIITSIQKNMFNGYKIKIHFNNGYTSF